MSWDLRLDGDVQRGGGLVGDQYLGLARQRHGDHGALTHAAGQLIGIFAHAARGVRDLHQLQQLLGLRQGVAARQPLVQHERFADLLAHRDHGGQQVASVELDAAARDPAGGAQQAHDG
ncbi:hypothetical protein G6F57_020707 [Rhizopus arrhizus]|nr:hypothetical protein G6F57_020707 [Rhizopus arrhizus]